MHVPLSSETEENQAAIKKVLSQTSIQFIMTNKINKCTTLLNSKKDTMPKNVYNILSNNKIVFKCQKLLSRNTKNYLKLSIA